MPADRCRPWFLPALLTLALGARLCGIGHGYPAYVTGDEKLVCFNAVGFLVLGSLEPTHFNYPALYSYLFGAALYLYYLAGGLWDLGSAGASAGLAWLLYPGQIALVGRLLSALAGVGVAAATYALGKRLYGEPVALGGALFAAFSPLLVASSQAALPDISMTLFAALSCCFMAGIAQEGRRSSYLAAGFALGLAVTTKYNAGMLLPGLLASHLLNQQREGSLRWKDGRPLLAGGAFLLAFLLGSPYWLFAYEKYCRALLYERANMAFSLAESRLPWLTMLADIWSSEGLWGLAGMLGCAYALWRRRRADWLLAALVLPAALYIGSWPKGGAHYLVFVFPLAGLLGARLVLQVKSRRLPWLGPALLALLSVPALLSLAAAARNLARENAQVAAMRWIEQNLPGGAVIGLFDADYCPPLRKAAVEKRALQEQLDQHRHDPEVFALLHQVEQETPFYECLDLVYETSQPEVPPEYQGRVDLADPKIRRIFCRSFMSYERMKQEQVRYLILPQAAYGRFFAMEPPPEGTAAHYLFARTRLYIGQFLDPSSARYRLVKEFGGGELGARISLLEVL